MLFAKRIKVLHITQPDLITERYFKFIQEKFDVSEHEILIRDVGRPDNSGVNLKSSTVGGLAWFFKFFFKGLVAEKIILHGMSDIRVAFMLFFFRWFCKKTYWVIWGGDLYQYNEPRNRKWVVMEFFRRPVIKSVANILTYIPGDYKLAVKWYGAKGTYHECVMYPSNVFVGGGVNSIGAESVCVQVGNSADSGNYHFEILDKLSTYKGEVKVFAPLSYGDEESARQVIAYGTEVFGDDFHALTKLMSFEDYMSYLSEIDIAVFNHRRQQAMGNTISLLGMGKKVFIRSDVTPWGLFVGQGLIIGDIENFELKLLTPEEAKYNSDIIKAAYSFDKLYSQWKGVFDGR